MPQAIFLLVFSACLPFSVSSMSMRQAYTWEIAYKSAAGASNDQNPPFVVSDHVEQHLTEFYSWFPCPLRALPFFLNPILSEGSKKRNESQAGLKAQLSMSSFVILLASPSKQWICCMPPWSGSTGVRLQTSFSNWSMVVHLMSALLLLAVTLKISCRRGVHCYLHRNSAHRLRVK